MKLKPFVFLLFLIALIWGMLGVTWTTAAPQLSGFDDAQPINIGLDNAIIGVTLGANEEHYYSFTAEAGHTYVIETFNIQGTGTRATGIWLYNGSQSLITNDQFGTNGTGNGNARLTQTFVNGGDYYIRVSSATYENWTGTYSLRILPKYDEPGAAWGEDGEPNDVLPLATLIQPGWQNAQTRQLFPHNNFVTNGPDHDWYHFDTPANRTYVFETFNIQGSPGSRATGIWLYNENGSLIANDQFGTNGSGVTNARLTHTFVNAGTYFILVRRATYQTWTGTYSLRILPKYDEPGAGWDADNDMEPNDAPALAVLLEIGATNAQTHQLAPHYSYATNNSDHDYYRFVVETPGTYVMETFGIDANSRATGLWLYNETGALLQDDQFGDWHTGRAHIEYEFFTPGTYILLVKDAQYEDWTGTYSVRVCQDSCNMLVFLPLIKR